MKRKTQFALAFAGVLSSSVAFADMNLTAQHQLISSTDISTGSETVFDITINNIGSDDLTSLSFLANDSQLAHDISVPVFEVASLNAGSQLTIRVTISSPISSNYFDTNSLLLLTAKANNQFGDNVSTSVIVEGGMQ